MATILTKKSDTASSVPSAAQLTNSATGAELAVNTADKRLYTKDSGGNVVELGTNPTSLTTTGSVTSAGASNSGNLNFTGTGNRITGDFSNATIANRVLFQNSTVNANTVVGAIPNGTGNYSEYRVFNSSDPANASELDISVSASAARIRSDITGTGTYLPMVFTTGGSERVRIDTSGNVGIGTSSPAYSLDVVKSSGDASIAVRSGGSGAAFFRMFASTQGLAAFNGIQSLYGSTTSWSISGNGSNDTIAFNTAGNERARIDSNGNLLLGGTTTPGAKVLYIANATTVPATNPSGGGVLYVEGGALKYRGSSGTVTTIANA